MHLKDTSYPNEEPSDYHPDPWLLVDAPAGRGSLISFDIMLGAEQADGGTHPNLFYDTEKEQRVSFIFRHTDIHLFMEHASAGQLYTDFPDNSGLAPERWHRINVVVGEDEPLLFVNGKRREVYPIPSVLEGGTLGFESHGEAWVRGLSVSGIDGYEVM